MTAQTVTTKNNSSIAQNNRNPILRRPGRRKKIPVLPYLLILPEIIKMLLGLLFIAPLLIGILFSFQSEQELGAYPLHLLSNAPTLQNYLEVIKAVPLFSYLLNSGIVCLVSIATQIVIACLAAYGFVFFEFPLKKLLFSLVLMTTMIPGE